MASCRCDGRHPDSVPVVQLSLARIAEHLTVAATRFGVPAGGQGWATAPQSSPKPLLAVDCLPGLVGALEDLVESAPATAALHGPLDPLDRMVLGSAIPSTPTQRRAAGRSTPLAPAGDGPWSIMSPRYLADCSPHLRGWSPRPDPCHRLLELLPASAGMVRVYPPDPCSPHPQGVPGAWRADYSVEEAISPAALLWSRSAVHVRTPTRCHLLDPLLLVSAVDVGGASGA